MWRRVHVCAHFRAVQVLCRKTAARAVHGHSRRLPWERRGSTSGPCTCSSSPAPCDHISCIELRSRRARATVAPSLRRCRIPLNKSLGYGFSEKLQTMENVGFLLDKISFFCLIPSGNSFTRLIFLVNWQPVSIFCMYLFILYIKIVVFCIICGTGFLMVFALAVILQRCSLGALYCSWIINIISYFKTFKRK